jgi:hypothetical protein
LYALAMQKLENLNLKRVQREDEKAREEMQEVTFRPWINNQSANQWGEGRDVAERN